jgi:bifunctional DNA-binding transcriptional regulator/antitoxin component of YhaV-PrlF toxin-antitoxin module
MPTLETPIKAEARLRHKNQITLPEPIAQFLEARPDDILIFEADPADPRTACVRLLPRTYAGSMTGVYGTTDDVLRYLHEEHESWG